MQGSARGREGKLIKPSNYLSSLQLALAQVFEQEILLATTHPIPAANFPMHSGGGSGQHPDSNQAVSRANDPAERARLIALVELARDGDREAFGQLYDHYQVPVYRFIYYRVNDVSVAEDLTSDTFFRALRSMSNFTWQGRDFGAWLFTISRNLVTDHYKSHRVKLEDSTEDHDSLDHVVESHETMVLENYSSSVLTAAIQKLPEDQKNCLIFRFLQGMTLIETAAALNRTPGAIKQLQFRALRNVAQQLPKDFK